MTRDIDIFVHYKQLDYIESSRALDNFNKGDSVKVKIIDIKDDKVNGSIRALKKDPFTFFDGKKLEILFQQELLRSKIMV